MSPFSGPLRNYNTSPNISQHVNEVVSSSQLNLPVISHGGLNAVTTTVIAYVCPGLQLSFSITEAIPSPPLISQFRKKLVLKTNHPRLANLKIL